MITRYATIAVVEDDAGVRTALGELLRAAEYDALTFASAEDFLESDRRDGVDCLIADVNLPGMSGVGLLKALAARSVSLPAVLITARDDPATRELMRQAGAVPHLRKPFSDDELFDAIRSVLRA
jgi:FixJ family two-component response regulator